MGVRNVPEPGRGRRLRLRPGRAFDARVREARELAGPNDAAVSLEAGGSLYFDADAHAGADDARKAGLRSGTLLARLADQCAVKR